MLRSGRPAHAIEHVYLVAQPVGESQLEYAVVDDGDRGYVGVRLFIAMARSLEMSHRIALGASSLRAPPDEARPGEDEAELPAAQVAVDDLEVVDPDLGFAFGMASMKMGKP